MKSRSTVAAICAAVALAVGGIVPALDAHAQARPTFNQSTANAGDEVPGVKIPDSKLARDAAQLIRESEGDFLFQHSTRVYYWAATAESAKVSLSTRNFSTLRRCSMISA